jgi:hypothetical protein
MSVGTAGEPRHSSVQLSRRNRWPSGYGSRRGAPRLSCACADRCPIPFSAWVIGGSIAPPSESHVDLAAANSLRPATRHLPAQITSPAVRYPLAAVAGRDLPVAACSARTWAMCVMSSQSARRSGLLVGPLAVAGTGQPNCGRRPYCAAVYYVADGRFSYGMRMLGCRTVAVLRCRLLMGSRSGCWCSICRLSQAQGDFPIGSLCQKAC